MLLYNKRKITKEKKKQMDLFPIWRKPKENVTFEDIPADKHPQPDLIRFYKVTRIYFWFEALWVVVWAAQMFAFQFGIERVVGSEYRDINSLVFIHLGTPIATVGYNQQWRNNNSVLGWMFWVFFFGFGADLKALLEIATGNLTQTVLWAWGFSLAISIYGFTLSIIASWRFIYWFFISNAPSIPKEASLISTEKSTTKSYNKPLLHTV